MSEFVAVLMELGEWWRKKFAVLCFDFHQSVVPTHNIFCFRCFWVLFFFFKLNNKGKKLSKFIECFSD